MRSIIGVLIALSAFGCVNSSDPALPTIDPDCVSCTDAEDMAPDAADDGAPDLGVGRLTVRALQDETHPDHPEERAIVTLEGVIVTTPQLDSGFWVSDLEGGPYSGIWVYTGGLQGLPPRVEPGDIIEITGRFEEYREKTEINATSYRATGEGTPPPPIDVTTADVATGGPLAETYEGVVVRVTDVVAEVGVEDFAELAVRPVGGGTPLSVGLHFWEYYVVELYVGDRFSSLTGVLDSADDVFTLVPRNCADWLDVGGASACDALCGTPPQDVPSLRNVFAEGAPPSGCPVRLEDVVVTTPVYLDDDEPTFIVQQPAGGAWGAIAVHAPFDDVSRVEPNTRVTLEGRLVVGLETVWIELDQLETSGPAEATPTVVRASDIGAQGALTLAYENLLVRLEDVVTTREQVPEFDGIDAGRFDVANIDQLGGEVRIGSRFDASFAGSRAVGQRFESVTGVFGYLDFRRSVEPRAATDIVTFQCAAGDADCDGEPDTTDNCPEDINPLQLDDDADGRGDRCDVCSGSDDFAADTDADGRPDLCDNCPDASNPLQADLDVDGVGDACDLDSDGDLVDDAVDNCDVLANPAQQDTNADGVGDACVWRHVPIRVDGVFDDWSAVVPAADDGSGDAGPTRIDFGQLHVADDDDNLFLEFEISEELSLNESPLSLHIDADDDPSTGTPVSGIGADLSFRFGPRAGTLHGTDEAPIIWQDIKLRTAPTTSSKRFEIAISRATLDDSGGSLFSSPNISLVLRDDSAGGDEVVADHVFDVGDLPAHVPLELGREEADDLRVVTYNTLWDSLWDAAPSAAFARQLTALDADVIVFQEVFRHTLAETLDWATANLGGTWSGAGVSGTFIVSRHAVTSDQSVPRTAVAVLDVDGEPFAVIGVHPACCGRNMARQLVADGIIAALRDGGSTGTPFVIAGDTNFVRSSQQLRTLLIGDIINENEFGADAKPDLDGSDITVVPFRHTDSREAYTWRDDTSSFWPGLLDYIIYSDSVLELRNHYVLNTAEMSPERATDFGVEATDAGTASDHLPVIADFRLSP